MNARHDALIYESITLHNHVLMIIYFYIMVDFDFDFPLIGRDKNEKIFVVENKFICKSSNTQGN